MRPTFPRPLFPSVAQRPVVSFFFKLQYLGVWQPVCPGKGGVGNRDEIRVQELPLVVDDGLPVEAPIARRPRRSARCGRRRCPIRTWGRAAGTGRRRLRRAGTASANCPWPAAPHRERCRPGKPGNARAARFGDCGLRLPSRADPQSSDDRRFSVPCRSRDTPPARCRHNRGRPVPAPGTPTRPRRGAPSSISAMLTVNWPFRSTNSRVPSRGSTSQYRRQRRRASNGGGSDSSDKSGNSGVRTASALAMTSWAARSASVRGDASDFRCTSKSDS